MTYSGTLSPATTVGPLQLKSGIWYPDPSGNGAITTANTLGTTLRLVPFPVQNGSGVLLSSVFGEVSTATDGYLRMGIYTDNAGTPSALVYDAGLTTYTDAVINNGSTTLTSATAVFSSADTGRTITDLNGYIPGGTTMTYVSATQVTLSAAATGTGTAQTIYLDRRISGASATVQEKNCRVSLAQGWYWIGACVQDFTGAQPTIRILGSNSAGKPIGNGALVGANTTYLGYTQSGVTGALPSTFTGIAGTSNAARIGFKGLVDTATKLTNALDAYKASIKTGDDFPGSHFSTQLQDALVEAGKSEEEARAIVNGPTTIDDVQAVIDHFG